MIETRTNCGCTGTISTACPTPLRMIAAYALPCNKTCAVINSRIRTPVSMGEGCARSKATGEPSSRLLSPSDWRSYTCTGNVATVSDMRRTQAQTALRRMAECGDTSTPVPVRTAPMASHIHGSGVARLERRERPSAPSILSSTPIKSPAPFRPRSLPCPLGLKLGQEP